VAVRDLWFGVRAGEALGFLGINGAGKTTTLQILTGAITPTTGTASLKGLDIRTQQQELRRHLGYCPQFDALVPTLTGAETLALYARIKGVPEQQVSDLVDKMIERMSLQEYRDRPCGGYSGGNKRKVGRCRCLFESGARV
jgi:ATP-binding cassette subfamily A (ABC1) protein 3